MANIVVGEEGFSFNYEWIAAGSGIGEEICGVDKDCIVVPSSPLSPKIEPMGHSEEHEPEYITEIQVTEEEVVTDEPWNSQSHGSVVDGLEFRVDSGQEEDVFVPLSEEQDEYSRLHPYPCDFCSLRFSKKSSLTAHMISHQIDKAHSCNLCGEQYRRKSDLVEHMKIHAYAPIKEEPEEEYIVYSPVPQVKSKHKTKRKKKTRKEYSEPIVKVRKTVPDMYSQNVIDNFIDIKIDEGNIFEDIKFVTEEPKFPIVDPNKPYVCQHCGVGFAREKALSSHTMVHVGDSAFDCDTCGDMFQSEEQLRRHSCTRQRKEVDYQYRPPRGAGGAGGRRDERRREQRSGDTYGTFLCNQCNLSFPWYNQLKKHRKTHIKQEAIPVDEDGHLCTLCNVVFNTLEGLLYHKQDHDSEIGVHTCYICGEMYESLIDLTDHVRGRHKATHMCEVCDKIFQDTKARSKHMLSHVDGRSSFACKICNRKLNSKAKLRKHMLLHDENKTATETGGVSCRECGELFDSGQSLLSHRQSAHGVNISRMFPCLQCGKAFNSRSSHQIHLRIHTGERPYACRYCWKAFGDGGTLRKHERIHTGEKPYVCPVCSKAFNQRVVLREHIRAHHSGTEGRLGDNCYECLVCGTILSSSPDLCAHLVLHSDENTAKHRTPKGGRKYSRKIKREDYLEEEVMAGGAVGGHALLGEEVEEEECLPEQEEAEEEDRKPVLLPPSPLRSMHSPFQPHHQAHQRIVRFSDELDSEIKLDGSEGKPEGKGRARIVRSGKRGAAKGQNKRYIRGKTKVARLLTNTSYASKYVVSRPEDFERTEESSPPPAPAVNGLSGRSRPRTKNVSYHNMKAPSYEPAVFPVEEEPLPAPVSTLTRRKAVGGARRRAGARREREAPLKVPKPDNQYVNGIELFDEGATPSSAGEQIETCIVDNIDAELEVKASESEDFHLNITPEDISMKATEYVSCDMCSEVFSSRSELLKHIQIHI